MFPFQQVSPKHILQYQHPEPYAPGGAGFCHGGAVGDDSREFAQWTCRSDLGGGVFQAPWSRGFREDGGVFVI